MSGIAGEERANQREQATRRVLVDPDLGGETLSQQLGRLVVDTRRPISIASRYSGPGRRIAS